MVLSATLLLLESLILLLERLHEAWAGSRIPRLAPKHCVGFQLSTVAGTQAAGTCAFGTCKFGCAGLLLFSCLGRIIPHAHFSWAGMPDTNDLDKGDEL
jgi:hypothetical protein